MSRFTENMFRNAHQSKRGMVTGATEGGDVPALRQRVAEFDMKTVTAGADVSLLQVGAVGVGDRGSDGDSVQHQLKPDRSGRMGGIERPAFD